MKTYFINSFFILITLSLLILTVKCSSNSEKKEMTNEELVSLGKYLVASTGCDDCHTPKINSPAGPVPDTSRRLMGYPQGETLPPLDPKYVAPGNWYVTEKNLAAWVGPWGISYASNLTPDNETGIGTLSEEMFIKTIREGKYMGVGRPLLPPMPWPSYALKTDQDLKAIYAYLKTLKPIKNQVPQPVPPDKLDETFAKK